MFGKWSAATAAVLGLGIASAAMATPRELVGIDGNGKTVDSGWSWDVSASQESLVNLVFIRLEGNNFFFEKDAHLTRADDPLVVRFNKTNPNADNLVINDETVANLTGVDWTAFRMELSSGSVGGTPNFAFVTSDGAPGIGDFRIDPFTQFQFYNGNSGLLVTGGTVKNGATWFPGDQSKTGLAIMANASDSDSFSLKEIPVAGITIPVPAAAWSGLSVLLGLGAIGVVKRVRKLA